MKHVVVGVAAAVLLLSLLFPQGLSVPAPAPVTPPEPPAPVAPVMEADPTIRGLLAPASTAEKRRIADVYKALKSVVTRDAGQRINTTEKWAEVHANTLQLAIEVKGKYPGLDVAIEDVFARTVGTDDVLPTNPETLAKLLTACDIVIASAQ